MLEVTELKNGTYFEEDGAPFQVLLYDHIKKGRGHAIIKVKVKNLLTGAVFIKSYITGKRVEEADIEEELGSFVYRTSSEFIFKNEDDDEIELSKEQVGDSALYLQKGMSVSIAKYKGDPITITLPIKAIYKVKEAPPDARGNTAGSTTKEVVLESGIKVKTPMFIHQGDEIVVDTRNGNYVERA